jgi:chemotaxis protein methyltransferase CheR
VVLPELVNRSHSLNIWSAGCSNGAEAFSIAVLLKEMPGRIKYRILGTDMDLHSLEKARMGGPFKAESIKNIPQQYVTKYFTLKNNDYWVNDNVRENITFQQHNLLSDPFDKNFDLIACRNVTIYFTNEAKDKLNQRFHHALSPKGVLFIGATEFIPDAIRIGFSKNGTCLYRKELTAVTSNIS